MLDAQMNLGSLGVVISPKGAHSPEFWAERMVDKMMSVADTAPQPIRDQAVAFKARLREVALVYIREAMKSAHASALSDVI